MLAQGLQPGVVAHFYAIQPCIRKVLSQVTSVCKKSSARARGRLKIPKAPSPLSQEVEAAARSVARTRQWARRCPESWQSNTTWLESLCQHSGHAFWAAAVESVQRTEPPPDLLVKMVMVPVEALSVLKHVHLIFFHTEVTYESTLRCKAV